MRKFLTVLAFLVGIYVRYDDNYLDTQSWQRTSLGGSISCP